MKVFEGEDAGPVYLGIYKVKSAAVARTCASKLLTKANVQEYLKELRQKVEDDSVATVLELLQLHTSIVRARFADFMSNITAEKLRHPALKRVRVTDGPAGKVTTIELHGPNDSTVLLLKMLGVDKDGVNINIDARSVHIGEGAAADAKSQLIAEIARFAAREAAGGGNK